MTDAVRQLETARKVTALWARTHLPGKGGNNRVGIRQWRALCHAERLDPHPVEARELARVAYAIDWAHAGMTVVQSLVASKCLMASADHVGPEISSNTLLWITDKGMAARMNARAREAVHDG